MCELKGKPHGAGYMKLDAVRLELIQFLKENGSVNGRHRASDWRSCGQSHRRGRRMISKRNDVIGSYRQYRLAGVLLSAGA